MNYNKMIERLKETASRKANCDDPYFFDDIYNYGCDDGEILFARKLLHEIFDVCWDELS